MKKTVEKMSYDNRWIAGGVYLVTTVRGDHKLSLIMNGPK